MFDTNFASTQFLFTSQLFSNVLLCFDWFSLFVSFVLVLAGALFDWSTTSESYLMFNSPCPERMLITCCSSYRSSVTAFSTGFLVRKLVNFKLLPAMCCIALSKCASRSNHLVSLALYCPLHRFLSTNGSSALGLCIKRLSFRMSKTEFSKPHKTANYSSSPIEYFCSLSFKYLLPNAIGFISPYDCFCHSVISSPVLLAPVVTMLSLSFAWWAKQGSSVISSFF